MILLSYCVPHRFLLSFSLLLCFVACEPTFNQPIQAILDSEPGPHLLVLSTTYETGSFSRIDLATSQVTGEGPASSDAISRYWNGKFFIVNRLNADNIQVMDERDLSLINQYSVGVRSNPQDIAIIHSQKAYISRLADGKILIVHPISGKHLGEIDLTHLSETNEEACQLDSDCPSKHCIEQFCAEDGLPELSKMALYKEKCFVVIQRLNRNKRFLAKARGKIAVIDTTTDRVKHVMDTVAANPTSMVLNQKEKWMVVGQTGQYMDENGQIILDGILEKFDIEKEVSLGTILSEKDLSGNISGIAMISSSRGYAIRLGKDSRTEVVSFDTEEKDIDVVAASPCQKKSDCYTLTGVTLSMDKKTLFVINRDIENPRIELYSTATNQKQDSVLKTRLPPSSIVPYFKE